ncbi:MAG: hypothetical protein ONB13_13785, partial [candidate division KSB1 bacterium]|nr:hypothetical protein [candidate division KSB1 bacterium]
MIKMTFHRINIIFIVAIALGLAGFPCHAQPFRTLDQKFNLVSRKLEFARELQASFGTATTQQTLTIAEAKLQRARELMLARRFVLANQRLNDAEFSINEALMTLLKEPMRLRRENLEQKIQLATEMIHQYPDSQAQHWLNQAIEQRKMAEQAYDDREFRQAIRLFRRAEFLVQKALESAMLKDRSSEARAEGEARLLEQLLGQSGSTLASHPQPQVQKNYRQILKLIARAQQARARGDFNRAIDLYHQATRLLHRTRDLAMGKTDRTADRAFDELTALDELIETLQARMFSFQDDERIEFFMSHLEQVHQAAHRAMEQQDYQRVLLNTELARGLIEQIQTKMRSSNADEEQLIQQELDDLQLELSQLHQRLVTKDVNNQAKALLNYSQSARISAEEAIRKQDHRSSRYHIFIAKRLAVATDELLSNPSIVLLPSDTIRSRIQYIEK